MLYKEYDPEVLKRLQAMELSIMKDFDYFCREHEIEYFCCGGTLLGAVRHGGFIPWDDDLDVGMTREYYEKFLREAKKAEREGRYALMNFQENENFPVMITKWYRKGTIFRDEDAVTCGYTSGIAVDIFCFDQVADSENELRRQAIRTWLPGKLLVLRQIKKPTIYMDGLRAKITMLASGVLNRCLRLLPVSPKLLYRMAEHGARSYEHKNTRRVAFLYDPTPYTSMLPLDAVYPTRDLIFEGITLKGPARPEVYLRRRYGKNYMQLPPENKRHNHPPAELSFGNEE